MRLGANGAVLSPLRYESGKAERKSAKARSKPAAFNAATQRFKCDTNCTRIIRKESVD